MASQMVPSTQLLRSLRGLDIRLRSCTRCISTTTARAEEAQLEQRPSFYSNPDPNTVFIPRLERKLTRAGTPPIGSRRRRMAVYGSPGVPFNELPFQCFQEARKILIADREEKVQQIQKQRQQISKLTSKAMETPAQEAFQQKQLKSMQVRLEKLKILADINDPLVKKRFEDGKGDLNKPIYRFLAERKWREYRQKIQVQRITTMKVVPDVIPACDPVADLTFAFGKRQAQPGNYVDSLTSESPPRLEVQTFDRGEKVVTVGVFNPDVPNVEEDTFENRCHFLATNIIISPTSTSIDLARLDPSAQVILPWFPSFAQKGSPYHRLCIVVFRHKDGIPIDVEVARRINPREGLTARQILSRHQMLTPIAAQLFRTQWDENTTAVMSRAGVGGAELELKRKKAETLPYKRRNPVTFR